MFNCFKNNNSKQERFANVVAAVVYAATAYCVARVVKDVVDKTTSFQKEVHETAKAQKWS